MSIRANVIGVQVQFPQGTPEAKKTKLHSTLAKGTLALSNGIRLVPRDKWTDFKTRMSEVAQELTFHVLPISLRAPAELQDLDPEAYAAAEREQEERVTQALVEGGTGLGEKVLEKARDLLGKIAPNPDGSRKKLDAWTLKHLNEAVTQYQEFHGAFGPPPDPTTEARVALVMEALRDCDPDALRASQRVRNGLRARLSSILEGEPCPSVTP